VSQFKWNSWFVAKKGWLASVKSSEFSDAVNLLRNDIESVTGRKADLKISFYAASRTAGSGQQPDELIAELDNTGQITRDLWKQAHLVRARFTVAADNSPALEATIQTKWPDYGKISFQVTPQGSGDIIGRKFLNAQPRFLFWDKGIQ
jgi:hypothetical protein